MASVSSLKDLDLTSSLEGLQTGEQRSVLDVVAQLRKCGLESVLSLPQLVVCGDQSAGKSSVLEALTEIPFPRNDNLCTRYPTEIILRRSLTNSLTIKVIPDNDRPVNEQESIKSFKEVILEFDQLPDIMTKAMVIMGIDSNANSRAFAKDILSIEIEGPSRPQLTVVDLPGLIQTETKGVTKADLALVAEITDRYISQPRTICLAVISAANDYANQGILTKVRQVDPKGERTLGIITKPDRLPSGSGTENAFLALARNEDIFFNLGWHVLKNRTFDESDFSFLDRNASEHSYFRTSNFNSLPQNVLGIDALRVRLSQLLFEHVKQELPKLREDLQQAVSDSKHQLDTMGKRRSTPQDCKEYLANLSLDYYEVCKAAVGGHYEGDFFTQSTSAAFSASSPETVRRLRAVIQKMNEKFSEEVRTKGHKYQIEDAVPTTVPDGDAEHNLVNTIGKTSPSSTNDSSPIHMTKLQALQWTSEVLARTRGRELPGNFNPLLIGELFWEQSSKWYNLAKEHVERVAEVCRTFLDILLHEKCPRDVQARLWSSKILDPLKNRYESSINELNLLSEDLKSYPINYNHYYTDTIKKRQRDRNEEYLRMSIKAATTPKPDPSSEGNLTLTTVDSNLVSKLYSQHTDPENPDMEKHSCEAALDCLFAIYKVSQKTFVANVTTQVVERHIVKGLEKIFSPIVVHKLSDAEAEEIALEPVSAKRQRDFLVDRLNKLNDGSLILRGVLKFSG